MYLTSSPSSLLITCPYHLNLASLTFSVMSIPLLLISSPYLPTTHGIILEKFYYCTNKT
jgi:hypothetical protein